MNERLTCLVIPNKDWWVETNTYNTLSGILLDKILPDKLILICTLTCPKPIVMAAADVNPLITGSGI